MKRCSIKCWGISLLGALIMTGSSIAMPPTEQAIKQWIAQGVLQQKIENWQRFKDAGGCSAFEHSPLEAIRGKHSSGLAVNVVDTIYVIAILAECSDWLASGQSIATQASDFDSLLFSERNVDPVFNNNGSMLDFYLEGSYGTVYVKGDIFGWYMMPNTYASYVGSNDGLGGGGALMAGHAIDAAEAAGVDFSPYANGDNIVDGVIIIHPGAGAETGAYGIWSHRSSVSTRFYDGVQISAYTQNPEEYAGGISTMGVYSHEWGHVLGLPDLYDINSSSPGNGLGRWALMAGGSWNDNGRIPSQLSAWSKAQLGFVNVIWLDSNLTGVEFPAVAYNPVVYGMNEIAGGSGLEYWLVENRQKVGFDIALPGSGLMIYHVDNAVAFQNNRFRYKVALEQADGEDDLAINGGSDTGDPYPGSKNNRAFHDKSLPDSRDNDGGVTEVGVWNISNNDSLMTADLDVTFSRPWIELAPVNPTVFSDATGGDGDGILEVGETIDFTATLVNRMRTVYGGVITLSVDNNEIVFTQNGVSLGSDLITNMQVSNPVPVQFTIPADFESIIAKFTITLVADSVTGSGDQIFGATFSFDQVLGAPQILVVDDDGGNPWETRITSTVADLRFPNDLWDYQTTPPTGGDLSAYNTVIWHMGSNTNGGTLTAADVTAMKAFLDGGGNLLFSSMTGATILQTLDSAFMADYLHATLANTGVFGLGIIGNPGTDLAEDLWFRFDGNAPVNPFLDVLSTVGTAEASFHLSDDLANGDFGTAGISFTGSYRTIFMTYPIEFINDGSQASGFWPKDTLIDRALQYFRYSYPYVKTLFAQSDDLSALVSHTPVFAWNVRDTIAFTQTSYEIEAGTDNDWTTAELWSTGVVASVDTFTTYAGSALSDGATYYLRVRVNNGTYWSDWYESTFHMNSLPASPLPLSPAGGAIVDANPTLMLGNGTDFEGSSLSYQYEVYDDAGLTSIITTSPDIAETTDSTAWAVDVTLSELTDYWWRAKSFDGSEYGAWSSPAQFKVISGYVAPTGSLSFTPMSILPCDTECVVQQVAVSASKPLTAAVIPVSIPAGLSICGVNFDGLPTASWDLNTTLIEPDSGYILVTLGNSFGDTLPSSISTVFNIEFSPLVPCSLSSYINWDTSRYDIPSEQLKFTDTFEVFSPDFLFAQDTAEIIGYTPGDIDGNPGVDIGDLTQLIGFLFISGPASCNINASDINGDCVGPDIGDLTTLIGFLFISGSEPSCGCVLTNLSPAPVSIPTRTIRSDIEVSSITKDGFTLIELKSEISLRGIQLELVGSATVIPENLQESSLDLLKGSDGNNLKIVMVDLDGPEVMRSGTTKLVKLEGSYEINSATVSDLNHTVWAASLGSSSKESNLPQEFALEQNYPNPFNPTTLIIFALPTKAHARLEIYNALGRRVTVLVDEEREAGFHSVEWDGLSDSGNRTASGVYLYRLVAGDYSDAKKMILLK